ncbi:MAG: hypothetical protein WCK86_04650 [Planctomycetia bacterium]
MALRIEQSVLRGEIRNSRKNSVSGWLEVLKKQTQRGQTSTETAIVAISLAGNLAGEFSGKDFRFRVREHDITGIETALSEDFHLQQVGVMGDSLYRMVRVPLIPTEEFLEAVRRGDAPPEEQRVSLYLEWFSQNGRVVLELLDPRLEFDGSYLEFADPEPGENPDLNASLPPSMTTIVRRDDGSFEVFDDSNSPLWAEEDIEPTEAPQTESEDIFNLFESGLEDRIRQSAGQETPDFAPDKAEAPATNRPSWEDLIPGINAETKALYEQWDEVLHGRNDEPLMWLFEEPLSLPKPADLRDEQQAWEVLATLLGAMALRGVAFEMCPHFSAGDAYRLLIEELLPEANVHPNLVQSGFVCHFNSWEFCDECQREITPDA